MGQAPKMSKIPDVSPKVLPERSMKVKLPAGFTPCRGCQGGSQSLDLKSWIHDQVSDTPLDPLVKIRQWTNWQTGYIYHNWQLPWLLSQLEESVPWETIGRNTWDKQKQVTKSLIFRASVWHNQRTLTWGVHLFYCFAHERFGFRWICNQVKCYSELGYWHHGYMHAHACTYANMFLFFSSFPIDIWIYQPDLSIAFYLSICVPGRVQVPICTSWVTVVDHLHDHCSVVSTPCK